MIRLGSLQRQYEKLFTGDAMPKVGPAVLVEADRTSSVSPQGEHKSPQRWRTEQFNVEVLKSALRGRVDVLQALVPLVSDEARVFEIVKSARNASAKLFLGRAQRNDVVIDDKTISSVHASLELDDKTAILTDQKSSNGTFVNLIRLVEQEPRILKSGDSVRFGSRLFYFLTGESLITLLALRIVDAGQRP